MDPKLFSIGSLHTVSGGSLAVLLIVQLTKEWPLVRILPTKLVSVIIGELLVFSTSGFPHSVSSWVILLLNGILISSTAIGSWHLAKGVATPGKGG